MVRLTAAPAFVGGVIQVPDRISHGPAQIVVLVLELAEEQPLPGVGAAADRALVGSLGVDLDDLLRHSDARVLDRPVGPAPLLPLGAGAARERCARAAPPIGLDAQAVQEASLRLALARRERHHRPEHLALALVALDPGAAWVLAGIGTDRRALLAELAAAFPPPARNPLLRAERRLGRRLRHGHLVRRYRHLTGRAPVAGEAAARLITC
ncbi:hypothetical protein [Kitasatospora sp. NBC_01266]|uniref:hypothetical protein n=1 Tax=Kitasatospora sp. NBC_01266 TaxID=2903572 RepID=UPI002E303D19|nr:hypothetical protein [Kitasatospora sp. NBC_01266]